MVRVREKEEKKRRGFLLGGSSCPDVSLAVMTFAGARSVFFSPSEKRDHEGTPMGRKGF